MIQYFPDRRVRKYPVGVTAQYTVPLKCVFVCCSARMAVLSPGVNQMFRMYASFQFGVSAPRVFVSKVAL